MIVRLDKLVLNGQAFGRRLQLTQPLVDLRPLGPCGGELTRNSLIPACFSIQAHRGGPMALRKLVLIAGVAMPFLSAAHANCYTVYKGDARIYHAMRVPVDTSLPYSETVPARFGAGATMIVTSGAFDCPNENQIRTEEWGGAGQAAKADEVAARDRALANLAERHSIVGDDSDSGGSYGGSSGGGQATGPIMTGQRGGRYYINSSGNKTYVGSSGSRSGGSRSGGGKR